MSTKDGGPAFPTTQVTLDAQGVVCGATESRGMSLRDWFAGQALTTAYCNDTSTDPDKVAEWAFHIADAMLKAREGKQ